METVAAEVHFPIDHNSGGAKGLPVCHNTADTLLNARSNAERKRLIRHSCQLGLDGVGGHSGQQPCVGCEMQKDTCKMRVLRAREWDACQHD